MALADDILALPTTVGDGNTGHLNSHQVIHAALKDHESRLGVRSLVGIGSPEGRVAATVGTTYTDTTATTGAVQWVKVFGTQVSGWQVRSGTTGWRNMNSQVANHTSGSLYVMRSTDLIHIHFDGLVISPETNPFWFTLFTLPEGMRPQRTIHTRMEMGAGADPGDRYISVNVNGEFRINFPQNHSGEMWGYMTFAPRDRTWPATLPGTPT